MMHSQDLPPIFWAKVFNCGNYIQNCTTHQGLDHMTPKEAWSGTKLDVSYFRVFGIHSQTFISKIKHKALEKKSKPLIFVGYSEDMKAYRFIDINTHDIFFHTHVQFDEHLPNSPSSSPYLVLLDSCDTSFEVFHMEDILEFISPTIAIDPPKSTIASTPIDVASSSIDGCRMCKWAHSTLEDVTPFIKDLPPSCHYSTISILVRQA